MSAKNRKLQVFVSSTYEDLKEERQAAVQAILNASHIPAGMELFAAGDKSQMEVIKEWIEESDVYLLILGGRYGTIEPESGKSYIHLEYEYAVKLRMPLFSIVMNQDALEKKNKEVGSKVLELENPDKFREFKKFVMSKMVRPWDDLKDIRLAVFESLAEFSKREELTGWVRGDQAVNSGALAEELARLGKENSELRQELLRLSAEKESYNGLSFNEVFEILEDREVNWEEIKYLVSHLECEEGDAYNFNHLITILLPEIDGINRYAPHEAGDFFKTLQNLGLIKYSMHQGASVPEFTETGRKYALRLKYSPSKNRHFD